MTSSPDIEWPRPDAGDEQVHPPGDEVLWNESWYFDFHDRDGVLGGYVRLGLYPNLGVAWYWACVVGTDRRTVLVADHEVALPTGRSLGVRGDGLWADHNAETPLEHWSLGLEAFGVALDHPADAYHGMRGDRTPVGFDLEWETDGLPFRYPVALDRYEVPCRVHGEILVGDETIQLDGFGQRDHSWGVRDWWEVGWCWTAFRTDDGGHWHGVTTLPGEGLGIGYVPAPAGDLPVPGSGPGDPSTWTGAVTFAVRAEPAPGSEGIPPFASVALDGVEVAVEPVAWAPVLLTSPDGRLSRFPRGLARFSTADGRSGPGWIEFNQPQT